MNDELFDYIVVGAGSAGAVVASRLSENEKIRVLCLEAGTRGSSHFWTKIPVGIAWMLDDPRVNWCYRSEPEAAINNRQLAVPGGKILGGSSAINGMVYVRGQRQDYDGWAQMGCRGWDYETVLPLFRKMESFDGGDDGYRGRDGPLQISTTQHYSPIFEDLFRAAEAIGIKRNADYNGAYLEGISMTQSTIKAGLRQSTATGYLDPARKRRNLSIRAGSAVQSLIIENGRCLGVRYKAHGQLHEARVEREVIVSCGTINSPRILELSGIGRRDLLERHGISVVHHLPGVGENLRDHFSPIMKFEITRRNVTVGDVGHGWRLILEAMKYVFLRKGFIGSSATAVRIFFRTRDELEWPDALISISPMIAKRENGRRKIVREPGIRMNVNMMRPESTGSIHIRSADPEDQPAIRFNFLATEADRSGLLIALRKVRELMAAPPIAAITGREMEPGKDVESDEDLLDWVRNTAGTTYHPVGTCKMGIDPMAVVDEQLRVHGISGLRVADASIMPTMISGNTNAPTIMIGEKCAEMLLADGLNGAVPVADPRAGQG